MLHAATADEADFVGSEPVLDRLDLGDDARANLAHRAGVDEERFGDEAGWRARVVLDGVTLLLRGADGRWAILAPAGSDESDTALAARRLHGLLGEQSDGWDLDR